MADVSGAESLADKIRAKYAYYGDSVKPNTCVNDIRLLLEEIKRLEEIEWMYENLNK